jgi:hypothetical protein
MPNGLPVRNVAPYRGRVKFGVIPERAPTIRKHAIGSPVGPVSGPPPVVDWIGSNVNWGVMLNDTLNDCVVACMGHVVEAWTQAASTTVVIPDADILTAYSALSGYNPNTGSNNNGILVSAGMNYWQQTGLAGHKVDIAVQSNMVSGGPGGNYSPLISNLIQYYGVAILVFNLPLAAEPAFFAGENWVGNMGPGAGTEYHCVPALAYDQEWCDIVTWGQPQRTNWAFIDTYLVELWGVMGPDWVTDSGLTPTNERRADLVRTLSSMINGIET